MIRRPPRSTRTDTLFPYTTLFRSADPDIIGAGGRQQPIAIGRQRVEELAVLPLAVKGREGARNIVMEREVLRVGVLDLADEIDRQQVTGCPSNSEPRAL